MSDQSESDATKGDRSAAWRRARLVAALLLLAGYAVAAIWWYRECSVFISGDEPAQTTCAPPTVTSATVLVLLLLVLLLLWPDVSEIAVLGVTLKRRVEQAQRVASEARNEATVAQNSARDLGNSLQSLQAQFNAFVVTNASATSTATISQNFFPDLPWSEGVRSDVQRSVADLQRELLRRRHDAPTESSSAPVNLESVVMRFANHSDDELKMELIRQWEALDSLLGIQTPSRPRDKKFEDESSRELYNVQRSFIADYRETLTSVRSLRNAVAHARDVRRRDVENGLKALALIKPLAEDWLRLYAPSSGE